MRLSHIPDDELPVGTITRYSLSVGTAETMPVNKYRKPVLEPSPRPEKARLTWLRALVLLLPLSFFTCAAATTLVGRVIGVLDGDTIEVLDSGKVPRRVRLAGIDAPEKAQPFGQRSKQNLSGLVFGKQVEVDGNKTDKYGRTVGKVLVSGADANLAQVKSGFAWHYKQYASEQNASDRALYAIAEDGARGSRSGLWRDPKPMAPWDWRHGGKDEPTSASLASGCPCSTAALCSGPKGGRYCVVPNGSKRYLPGNSESK